MKKIANTGLLVVVSRKGAAAPYITSFFGTDRAGAMALAAVTARSGDTTGKIYDGDPCAPLAYEAARVVHSW